jgi:hypothetical protein
MNEPTIQMCLISNIWIKLISFKKGDVMQGHKHIFDHPHLLTQGSVEVDVEGEKTTFKAPHIIFIQKEKMHSITALEDNTVGACIHAIRDGDEVGDIIDPAMIPNGIDTLKALEQMSDVKPLINNI